MARGVSQILLGTGHSLSPLFPRTALIEWEPVSAKKFSLGQLVIYSGNRNLVCHQVLFRRREKGHTWYFLKGNHLLSVDGWIPDYRILGRVTRVNGTSCHRIPFLSQQYLFWGWEGCRFLLFKGIFASGFGRLLGKIAQQIGFRQGFFASRFSELTWKIFD